MSENESYDVLSVKGKSIKETLQEIIEDVNELLKEDAKIVLMDSQSTSYEIIKEFLEEEFPYSEEGKLLLYLAGTVLEELLHYKNKNVNNESAVIDEVLSDLEEK